MMRILILSVVVLGLVGCSAVSPEDGSTGSPVVDLVLTPSSLPSAPPRSFEESVASTIAQAEASGADSTQLALLKSAAAGAPLTYEDVELATEATFSCFEENGIGYTRMSPDQSQGFPIPQYSFDAQIPGLAEDETLAIADSCITEYSDFAVQVYVMQPSSVEIAEAFWNEHERPSIVECLEENGIPVPPDATRAEIDTAVWILWMGEDQEPPHDGPYCGSMN